MDEGERDSLSKKRINERRLSLCRQMPPEAMVDRLTASAQTTAAFFFRLSVFSAQVDVCDFFCICACRSVRMNGCVHVSVLLLDAKEENRAIVDGRINVSYWEK